jgi:methylated-DNA-protein-cysteine methyltransferase related protein
MSYGEVARLAGTSPRAVGRILHTNTDPDRYPCHRVIHSDGTLASGYAFGGKETQKKLLEAEGVLFSERGQVC